MKNNLIVYDVKKVSQVLKVSERTASEYLRRESLKKNGLKVRKIGREWRVSKEALDKHLRGE